MENFVFYSPTKFIFGINEEENVGKYIKEFGGSKILLHYGTSSAKKSGLIDKIQRSLEKENLSYVELGGVEANPKSSLVYRGIETAKKEKVDFILAVGGGSVIDSAKAVAMGALYDGDFWDFFSHKKYAEKALPIGTVLTIAAAGSEGSPNSVITHEDGMQKRACENDCILPKFSIMNPELTKTLSMYQKACGITDMMAHVMERYFSNTENVEVTDRLCEGILKSIINETLKLKENIQDYQINANIMLAGMLAHNDVCGIGREQDWGSHAIEHELSALYDCPHGAGLAVVFPAWMEYVINSNMNKFVQFALRVWNVEMDFENPENTAREGIRRLKMFLSSIGMPLNFSQLGAKREDIPKLLDMLKADERKIGRFIKLTREDCKKIYEIAARD